MTLLELAIIVAILGVIVFIAMPTLHRNEEEQLMDFAKEQLLYLRAQEQAYFNLHGVYAPFKKIAEDEVLGRTFDQRFAQEPAVVQGITFIGPLIEGPVFDLVARLPGGVVYRITPTGEISMTQ